MAPANPLVRYFRRNRKRQIHKWMHYFDIYHRHFERFRNRPIVILEFGVQNGGSLQMWRDYFGRKARIFGVDIDPRCASLAEKNITILIGDQEDRAFLREVVRTTGPIDVAIDDGGHHMGQQIATFEEVYPHVKNGGVFLIEDLHTSYWDEYGGGYRRPGTFIEYAKDFLDKVNAWHSREPALAVDDFTRTTRSVHVYDSIIVLEKDGVPEPHHERTGTADAVPEAAPTAAATPPE